MFTEFCLEILVNNRIMTSQGRMPIFLLPGNSYSESSNLLKEFLVDNYDSIKLSVDNKKFKELKVILSLNNMECFSITFLKDMIENITQDDISNCAVIIWYMDLQ